MTNFFSILFGKLLSKFFRFLNLGSGSTWPGHIALTLNKHFIHDLLAQSKVKTILIAGTNGKTTTTALIRAGIEASGKKLIQNESGANLLNGIASTLLLNATIAGELVYDYALFEVDENTLPLVLQQLTPNYLVLLNLFRDQLDRYGEVNTIAHNWEETLANLTDETTLILNADDPQIAFLGKESNTKTVYFGLQDAQFGNHKLQHAADSVYCPNCGEKLIFDKVSFSHLGDWHCKKCGLKKPQIEKQTFVIYPLSGLYNKYNILAARLTLQQIGVAEHTIDEAFTDFTPVFGRQEIVRYKNVNVQIFLSKNPTSFNQSYQTIQELHGYTLLLVLNDRIPDGRDISWIWDVDLPDIDKFNHILIAGDRVYDMALRLKYALGIMNDESRIHTYKHLREAIEAGIKLVKPDETLFVLPTYSAMLGVRKIVTGKKIL
ncbi:MAG TPA: MurT ligase domain-containing protein [Methylomirabilota bacterium]|nr:MurT ligase domain-containing protein [Methylomirabilota bacterium]